MRGVYVIAVIVIGELLQRSLVPSLEKTLAELLSAGVGSWVSRQTLEFRWLSLNYTYYLFLNLWRDTALVKVEGLFEAGGDQLHYFNLAHFHFLRLLIEVFVAPAQLHGLPHATREHICALLRRVGLGARVEHFYWRGVQKLLWVEQQSSMKPRVVVVLNTLRLRVSYQYFVGVVRSGAINRSYLVRHHQDLGRLAAVIRDGLLGRGVKVEHLFVNLLPLGLVSLDRSLDFVNRVVPFRSVVILRVRNLTRKWRRHAEFLAFKHSHQVLVQLCFSLRPKSIIFLNKFSPLEVVNLGLLNFPTDSQLIGVVVSDLTACFACLGWVNGPNV